MNGAIDPFSEGDFESMCQFFQECGLEICYANEDSWLLKVEIACDMWLEFYFKEGLDDDLVRVFGHCSLPDERIVHLDRLNWPCSDMGWNGLSCDWPREKVNWSGVKDLKMGDFYGFLKSFIWRDFE